MKNYLRWYLRWQYREVLQENLWQMVVALAFIMSSVFALTMLSLRFELLLEKQSRDALTADLVLHSSIDHTNILKKLVKQNNLSFSKQIQSNTMAFGKDSMQLINIKGVDQNYPLKGQLLLKKDNNIQNFVGKGEVFLERSLLKKLELNTGDNISIGDADFIISGEIKRNPELSTNIFTPSNIFLDISDIEKTGAIQPGSRVRYQYYFSGNKSSLENLKKSFSLSHSERWEDSKAPSQLTNATQKAKQYTTMTLILIILISSVTILVSSQHFYKNKLKRFKILNYIGVPKKSILVFVIAQFSFIFISALLLAVALGVILEKILILFLSQLLSDTVDSANYLYPVLTALLSGFFIILPIWSEVIYRLVDKIIPKSIHLNNSNIIKRRLNMVTLFRIVFISTPIILLLSNFGTSMLLWLTGLGVIFAFITLGAISLFTIYFIEHYLKKTALPISLKLALSHLKQHPLMSLTQFGSLSLSLLLLSTLIIVKKDLLSKWEQWIPQDTPNIFAWGIPEPKKNQYQEVLVNKKLLHSPLYPIIRGRVTHLNGEYLDPKKKYNGEQERTLSREVNFTWRKHIPENNRLNTGSFTKSGVSVESGIAKRLNISLGDSLTFRINTEDITSIVNSIRDVEWRDFTPNFFFIFTPDILKDMPASYLVSFRLQDDSAKDISAFSYIAKTFPNVALLDLRQVIKELQVRLLQLSNALSILLFIAVASGVLLILTLLQQSLLQRQKQLQLYRLLGASKKQLKHTLYYEYGVMTSMASIIAVFFSELITSLIQVNFFEVDAKLHPMMWIFVPLLAFSLLYIVINRSLKRTIHSID